MEVPSLGQRIFLEGLVDLERVFLGPLGDSRVAEVDYLPPVLGEQRTQLAKLAAASRRDQQSLSGQERVAAPGRAARDL